MNWDWAAYLPLAEPFGGSVGAGAHCAEPTPLLPHPPLLPPPPAPPAPPCVGTASKAGAKRPAEGPRISLSVTCMLSFSDCRVVSFHSVSYQRLSLCVVSFCLFSAIVALCR
jgi:hypothetical protein